MGPARGIGGYFSLRCTKGPSSKQTKSKKGASWDAQTGQKGGVLASEGMIHDPSTDWQGWLLGEHE